MSVTEMDLSPQRVDSNDDAQDQTYQLAPHNIDAEQALLGAILINNDAFFRVSDFLEAKHFYEGIHQQIYEIIGQLIKSGKSATPITLKTFLPADEKIGDITLGQYPARLAANATTILNAVDFGHTIYDLYIRRGLISIGDDMVYQAYNSPVDLPPSQQIENTEKKLFDLAEQGQYDSGFRGFSDALADAIEMAGAAYQRDGHLSGIATGLDDLDRLMGGMQASDLIILAGRPAMGKTALATNIAFHVAQNYQGELQADGGTKAMNGGIVGFFSLEMSAEQLATRILAEQSGVSSSDIRRGAIDEHQFNDIVLASQKMQSIPFHIDHTGGLTIAQVAARARRLKRQRGLDFLIIDYLQLIQGSGGRRSENRVQEITEITTNLKALAKELNVPILALSQLSRQVESRDDKRPHLADLRESGSIEQDADVVMFVFREEYYLERQKPKEGSDEFFKWQAEMEKIVSVAEVIIGKQRHGPTGNVKLHFDAQLTRFSNLANEDRIPERYG